MLGQHGGALPDVIEPALSPRHRSTAHSWATLGLLASGGVFVLQHETMHPWLKVGLLAAGAGYAMHLISDAETPMGLPLV